MTTLNLPYKTIINDITWKLYMFEFKTADGTFDSYFYAISREHAAAILEEIKDTATLLGEMK